MSRNARRPQIRFLGSEYAGHKTRFMNLREQAAEHTDFDATFHSVTGWRPGGHIERLELLPTGLRGRLRATFEAAAVARPDRPDVIWTSCREELAPFFWAQCGPMKRPLVLDLDATDAQLESMAEAYFHRTPKQGLRRKAANSMEALVHRQATIFTPWSTWAADGLRTAGVAPDRIRIIPPGVDLTRWRPARKDSTESPLRVLFVGGDFHRKGGDLLLTATQTLPFRIEVTLVTTDQIGALPPAVVQRQAKPNSDELRDAFAWADIFVMPTRADCFGIATVEAMASGLPVIVSNVGGAPDIVEHGASGWLIDPNLEALTAALTEANERRQELPNMGARGRLRAEQRFDAARNDEEVIQLLLSLVKS